MTKTEVPIVADMLQYGPDMSAPDGSAGHEEEFEASSVYHYAAAVYLKNNVDFYMSKAIPQLTASEGVWHPSGFMIFRLGQNAALGTLRLHVWPAEVRQREDRGRGDLGEIWDGDIHDHSWFVDGFNISGYQDKLYDVAEVRGVAGQLLYVTEEQLASSSLLRRFSARYLDTGDFKLTPDAVKCPNDDAPCRSEGDIPRYQAYEIRERGHRVIGRGHVHSIDPDVFHAPVIPFGDFAATLALNSRRVTEGPHIMIGGVQSEYLRSRQLVTEDEWQAARERLLKCTL